MRSELPGVDPRDAPDCFQPHQALPGLERVVPPAELPGHYVVPAGRGPRPVGRPGAAVKVVCANHVHPAFRAVQVLARRARRAVAPRVVHRVPAEEEVVRPVRVAGTEAMRARSPRDGAGRGLPTGQSTRLPVALVQILEAEPAHVAPRGGRIVGVVSAGAQDVLELVPQEARRAGRRKRYPGVVAAEEPSIPRARASRRAGGRIPSAAGRGWGLVPGRRGAVPIVCGIPLLLADVGVSGLAPWGA